MGAFPVTTFGFIDYGGESARVAFHSPVLTDANVMDYTTTTVGTPLNFLKLAIDALTLLNETQISVGAKNIVSSGTLPTDQNAQREQGLLIKYIDTSNNKKYRFTIPGVDRSLVAQPGTDVVDFANNAYVAALVGAFENGYVSELGNPVQVYAASLVGRNN